MPSESHDPIDGSVLRAELIRPGSLWSRIDVVAQTGSTNADLAAAAREGAPAGMVLIADHQSAGRGRLGRTWMAPPGSSIAMSVLLRPEVAPQRWSWLPLLTGLAVSDALRQACGLPAEVKWPNDVLVTDRKISGVLAERVDTDDGPGAVLGMGINVFLTVDELPVPTATSVTLALAELGVDGTAASRTTIITTVLVSLGRILQQWTDTDDRALAVAYRERCGTLGRDIRVDLADGSSVHGTAEAVDEDGQLVLRNGPDRRTFAAGDIVHLR